jgi:hypothetical protein
VRNLTFDLGATGSDEPVDITFEPGPRAYVSIGQSNNRIRRQKWPGLIFWRLVGKNNQNLLSVELLETGELFGLELLVCAGVSINDKKTYDFGFGVDAGVPKFDIRDLVGSEGLRRASLGAKITDVFQDFTISLEEKQFRISFSEERIAGGICVGKRLLCEYDSERKLCAFLIRNLSEGEEGVVRK